MAVYLNAGENPLSVPGIKGAIAPGAEADIPGKALEMSGVAGWVKSGVLVAVERAKGGKKADS